MKRRWLVTFGFGLAYGFGFAFALRPALQFAGAHVPDVGAVLQRGHRARTTAGRRAAGARAGPAVPLRRGRTDRDDHRVRARRAHGVARDGRR